MKLAGLFILALTQLVGCRIDRPPPLPSVAGDDGQTGDLSALPAETDHQSPADGTVEKPLDTVVHTDPEPSIEHPHEFKPQDCLALQTEMPELPSGNYDIYPFIDDGVMTSIQASCDMETDGGGWTLVLNYNHKAATNPPLFVRTDSLPLKGGDNLGFDESLQLGNWGHTSNALLDHFKGMRSLRFFCRSSENSRVLHFKSDDANCTMASKTGTGGCLSMKESFIPLADHSAIIPGAMDRAELERGDETLTYNTFGKSEPIGPDRMWSIRAEPSQSTWECDFGSNNASYDTMHRVWIR